MAPPWKTFQRLIDVTENLVFNEAPKFIRTIQKSETLQRGIQTGIRIGIDAIAGTPNDEAPAITAGRPVSKDFVPTAQRARKLVYAPDLDGRADPGEIVWTWVVFEDDPTRGKDRPVLVVGRDRRDAARADAVQPELPPRTPTGWASAAALGLRGPRRAGCGWTACSTCPRRASGARARSWNAGCSTGRWPRAAHRILLELSAAPATSATCRAAVGQLDLARDLKAEPLVVRHVVGITRLQVGRARARRRTGRGATASAPGRNPLRGPSGRCR